MSIYTIEKAQPLTGSVRISGAKNSALPILAASILGEGESVIEDVPNLKDIQSMCELIRWLGINVNISDDEKVNIKTTRISRVSAPYELANIMRASFLIMGPLLARKGKVKIPLPGGCAIGSRPVDLHLKGFLAMGAKITQGHGYVEARAKRLHGAKIYLDFPSVGATENILMAACLADGQTIIENAAVEPEIVDLANYLVKMGADIKGAGTDTIKINGVKKIIGRIHTVIPDRIEAGTFMSAAAISRGKVRVENVVPDHLKPVTAKMREIGIDITEEDDAITVNAEGRFKPADIKTLPFPGFPTDLQSPLMSLLCLSEGTSIITETIFENRFMHVCELKRMGANIKIEGRSAVIEGVKKFTGAQVQATDLRAGAALVIAGLAAEGQTRVSDAGHIRRGYYNLEKKLSALGANICTAEDEDEI